FKEFFELPSPMGDKAKEERIKKKLLKEKSSKKTSLSAEQLKNESSNIRCVGLTLETRPDYAKLEHANEMLKLGCTRVELGIQTVYNNILKNIERGHTVEDSIESTRILKDLGLKINYHLMPGLPGVTLKQDLKALKTLFDNQKFRPDMLKIYPCMVLKGTKLYEEWKKGNYKPLTTEKAAKLIAEFKKYIPEYVRMMRVQRDIPTFMTEAGVDKTNLRQYIEKDMEKKGIKCRCIRCREIGRTKETIKDYKIKITEYDASWGKEFFIAAEKNNALIGFCRLRFPLKQLRKEITRFSALIRELHVYGESTELGEKGKTQHKGIGKELLKTAEKIAKENNYSKMVIISGIGARNYYRKLGYKKEGVYMVKTIQFISI
ncbi:MAG: tRNA uridine(34) 5-carboxymethylaminomethyl modification radical SAM/GNAT enzyme Elp3, partial [Nanoarchaeota archaeon]|nr:tRNA uridine(34) 5-carboxymethylaminomethyl modification radical SAM/GNAT enzyme Elp3 [Nanoarchaeota archaeon]